MSPQGFFDGRSVLVTGGCGSFGQAVIEELLRRPVSVVRVYDHDENGLWTLRERYREEKRVRLLLGDVRDLPRLAMACAGIDVVIHAAALKHVESCEYNPFEAVKTNVLGTQNVIDAALAESVGKVVLTSTDKAANPGNVMGTTKLLAEKLVVAANAYRGKHRTAFSCVRFGNVLGTRGSAPLLFREQIAAGGPVTITDRKMTRFVMTLKDAVRLVLETVSMTRGGETFILKMQSVRITDLAAVMIRELGGNRTPTKVTGTKPGEKLYEELMVEDEVRRAWDLPDMYLLLPNIPELAPDSMKAYPDAKPARRAAYRSDRARKLTQPEIAKLLRAEGLL